MNKLKDIEFTKEESKNLDQLISNSVAKGLDVILRRATTNNKDAAQLTQQLAETIEAINEEKLFSELRHESLIRKAETADRKSVVEGKRVSVSVNLGGGGRIKKK